MVALAVVVVVGCNSQQASGTSSPVESGIASPRRTTPTVAAGAPSLTAPPSGAAHDWVRVDVADFFDPLGRTSIKSVAVGAQRLLAAGSGPNGSAVWTSDDGIEWLRVRDEDGRFKDTLLAKALWFDHGWVVVGDRVMTSSDGVRWKVAPRAAEHTWISDVIAPSSGGLLIGGERGVDPRPWLARSADGLAWEDVAAPPGSPRVLAETRDGTIVVAAEDQFGGGVLWYRRGAEWVRAAVDGPIGLITDIVARADGRLVAIGSVGEDPGAWFSDDGRSWTAGTVPGHAADRWIGLAAAAVAVDGFVAVGEGPTGMPDVWSSTDGDAWIFELHDPDFDGTPGTFGPSDIAVFGDRMLVAGSYRTPGGLGGGRQAAVWTTPTNGVPKATEILRCGDSKTTLLAVLNTPPALRSDCFGGRTLVLRGMPNPEPGDCSDRCPAGIAVSVAPGADAARLQVFDGSASDPRPGAWASRWGKLFDFTGRFDDPTAAQCGAGASTTEEAQRLIDACRNRFVARSVKPAA